MTADTSSRVRLLAVMAADVAGYSRLMSLDDRGTVIALDAARAVFRSHIADHAGRVIDMAGDSVLAVFENATAAVQASLAIQRQLGEAAASDVAEERRMRFRIGVHLGDVIEKADGSVYGDGVNIAARLESLAAPGGVTVSESVHITVKGRIGARFEDQGEQRVKNIADPVKAYRVITATAMPATQALSTAAVAPATGEPPSLARLDAEPSIAVLSFDTADAEQAGFADGLADDLTALLATMRSLVVIARSSTMAYKGRAIDVRSLGQELGVRYVVEGSLRVTAQRMLLNARLIDCPTRASQWSERFDAPTEDLFAVQDEIAARIMNSIRSTIDQSVARASRKLTPQDLQAWQIRAQVMDYYRRWNRAEMLLALDLCRRGIELAPDEAEGHANLAACLWAAAISGWLPSGAAAIDEALAAAVRAVNLDNALPRAHYVTALVLIGLGRHDEAIVAAERSFELAPGDVAANRMLGQALAYAGRYDEALPYFDRALRLSPRDPMLFAVYQPRSIALFGLRRYEDLIASAQRVARQLPEWVQSHVMIAVGFAGLGKMAQASQALDEARKLDPRLTVQRVMRRQPIKIEADASRMAVLLRDAGLAEK